MRSRSLRTSLWHVHGGRGDDDLCGKLSRLCGRTAWEKRKAGFSYNSLVRPKIGTTRGCIPNNEVRGRPINIIAMLCDKCAPKFIEKVYYPHPFELENAAETRGETFCWCGVEGSSVIGRSS